MPGKIFINYRRDNAIAAAGRLHDRLAQAFGRGNLFMDVDHIPAGVDFVAYLGEQVAQCDVFLAVMAPGWLEAQDANGARRIDSPDDFVAIEIAAALACDVRVIPVLIDGARMPAMAELPPGLQQLARRNAVEVRNSQFGRDADVLIEKIREAMKAAAVQARKPRAAASVPWGWVGSTAASVLMLGYVGAYYAGVPVWWPLPQPKLTTLVPTPEPLADAARRSVLAEQEKKAEAERQRVAAVEAENRRSSGEQSPRSDPALSIKPGSGQAFRDCNDGCPEMVVVPAGRFTMGSFPSEIAKLQKANPSGQEFWQLEGPERIVTIRQPFAVAKFEVTFDEWAACVLNGGCAGNPTPGDGGWGKGRRPVINVSWDDAMQYVDWLTGKTGRTYRLLSEAEWEYAARAGGAGRWTFGDDEELLGRFGWYKQNSGGKTQPVGSRQANAFGLYDTHGNVWEWVEDCMHDGYFGAPDDERAWTTRCVDGSKRVIRGGSWDLIADYLRSAARYGGPQGTRAILLGFRVARTVSNRSSD